MVSAGRRYPAACFIKSWFIAIVFIAAEPAERFAVYTDKACERLRFPGPMTGILVGEVVGHRPYTEKGIVGDKWRRRRAEQIRRFRLVWRCRLGVDRKSAEKQA
jgi:hypothetical protein